MMMVPRTKAMAMEMKMPPMMANAFPLLIYSARLSPDPEVHTVNSETATAAPNSSNTNDTVVEVGKPKVLNRSKSTTSVSITVKKSIMMVGKVNLAG